MESNGRLGERPSFEDSVAERRLMYAQVCAWLIKDDQEPSNGGVGNRSIPTNLDPESAVRIRGLHAREA